ncbi:MULTISPECIES: hypothetical protein [unclassified Oceanispirochaeta]|uniref:hypothetical protein n=1 Tax=unclassified Oceanispirochaeta TaxID=2635722 RepID=UPI000E09431F|nr:MULTISPECIES: hypothetical protein [unclassified Oceanispirochaeta]MBF9018624.1 hypothetical protein [Oceanispirochaeta sp. M2]NPD75061.1 hypothetical protein [Oceanispirochaeta sp. M1]RDG29087.1 hypothetical protein DV872_23475 [Oceanispirochaeta sp. M1]
MIDLENDSKYQEQIVEYKFISDLMINLAYADKRLEVMRVHTDAFGYDLILKVDDNVKFIQLKSRKKDGKANYWDVHKSLLKQENGFVLIIFYELKNNELILQYHYLNKMKYQSTIESSPKYKKDGERYCKVSKKDLISINTLNELVNVLF